LCPLALKWRERFATFAPALLKILTTLPWPLALTSPTPRDRLPAPRRRRKILLLRTVGLGDILLCSVVARGVKEQDPFAHVTFATQNRCVDLLRHVPFLEEVLPQQSVFVHDYDTVLNFDPHSPHWFDFIPGEGEVERLDLICQVAGVEPSDKRPLYRVTPAERQQALDFLRARGMQPQHELIGVVLSSRAPTRTRGPAATAELLRGLVADRPRARIVLIDDHREMLEQVQAQAPELFDAPPGFRTGAAHRHLRPSFDHRTDRPDRRTGPAHHHRYRAAAPGGAL
jgi:hypothetical protein